MGYLMALSKADSIFDSHSLFSVILCVMRGANYSVAIANELGYSHSAAVQNLRKLEARGLLKKREDGAAVKYSVEWDGVASLWIDYMAQTGRKKNEINLQRIQYQMAPSKREIDEVKFIQKKLVQEIEQFRKNKGFALFTELYISNLATILDPHIMLSQGQTSLLLYDFGDVFGWFFDDYVNPYFFLKADFIYSQFMEKERGEKILGVVLKANPLAISSFNDYKIYNEYGKQIANKIIEGMEKQKTI